MKRTPIGDRVLIRRKASVEETDSGIIIPEPAREVLNFGTITAVGKGHLNTREDGETYIPLQVKQGDVVEFSKYGGTIVEESDSDEIGDLIMMREDDILCIVND